jgi:hypothetical protein
VKQLSLLTETAKDFKTFLTKECIVLGEILVPKTVAIEAIINDAMYFRLPENVDIKVAKKEVSLKDIRTLWATFEAMNSKSIADMSTMQHFSAALWVVGAFLSKNTSRIDESQRKTAYLSAWKDTSVKIMSSMTKNSYLPLRKSC